MSRSQLTTEELQGWYSFVQAHHQVLRQLDGELLREHRLPLASYEVLLWLAQSPGRSMKMADLARVCRLSPSGLTRLIDRLVRDGLVERRASGADARIMLAHLTDKGVDRFRKAAPTHVRAIKDHFTSKLGNSHLEQVTDALQLIIGEPECPRPPRVDARPRRSRGPRLRLATRA